MAEERVQSAMHIIMAAGDARLACMKALDYIAESDYEKAEEEMEEAQAKITEAHGVQTDAIQAEVNGDKAEYSLLFAHAQDTLMTIYSEINITKKMIKIFKAKEA